MSRERLQRWALALIALFTLPTAVQATSAPESWFEDFPLGRRLGAAEGATWCDAASLCAERDIPADDEHLVRDVDTADQVGLIASLVSVPLLAALSLWAGLRPPTENEGT